MRIVTDNGRPFKKHEVAKICEQFYIQQRFATLYYPRSNGQEEATNKTILKILKKVVNEASQDWHIHLNLSLWAYRSGVCMMTGATPYSLVYGTKAIFPIEVDLSSLRISLKNIISDEDHRVARLQELELFDEKRHTSQPLTRLS
ncbi:uncharacterized protein LOC131874010 [Cryptomeria japonica]|uniref:uncharacterized protein LOC131874010 n=1 Tax=Cryptomeria japonica TaxID=3369 RepID=UPI0027DA840C|nr:uncharacterized protein LOC131874010 [Cryptomeria japonica]